MTNWLERTELLIKEQGINKLQNANILIVGLGGVGSFAAEFIARSGVQNMTIVDGDIVDVTNINRQLVALHSTINQPKTQIMAQRIKDINPQINLEIITEFISPERAFEIVNSKFDYVIDCIDSITPKVNLIKACKQKKVKIISSMGAGGKILADKVQVKDISKTRDCKMARHLRKRLKAEGITKGIKCVYSQEIQQEESLKITDGTNFKKSFYGTISYMPALFGLFAAQTVLKHLLNEK